ncbi:MAG: bifunctional nuclease family protein [Deferrisomatales bacterium]
MYLQMRIGGVALDPRTKSPVVLLKDLEGRYTLPIWIGILEAAAIAYALEGVTPPRPMTHDLLKMLLEEAGARVPRIDVDALEESVFKAKIHLELPGGGKRLVDSRPSDALALALRVGAEIYAEEKVLKQASAVEVKPAETEAAEPEAGATDAWSEFLEDLDPDAFGKYKM